MSNYYEGRDLLKTEDIYGSQSSTALKYRNINQEQYMPEVIKNLPDKKKKRNKISKTNAKLIKIDQRQADLNKNIRNPHCSDYRYDLNQQHPQFLANSLATEYTDSLDSFKMQQEVIKNDILRNNSQINYDFIRMQKNKNSYQKLNPPFANLHSDIHERQDTYSSLKSPLMAYLQSDGFEKKKSNIYNDNYPKQSQSYSINQSPANKSQEQLINMNRSASQANINPQNNYSAISIQSNIFKPEEQSPINAAKQMAQQKMQSQQELQQALPNSLLQNNKLQNQSINQNAAPSNSYQQSPQIYQQKQQQQYQQQYQNQYPQDSVIGDVAPKQQQIYQQQVLQQQQYQQPQHQRQQPQYYPQQQQQQQQQYEQSPSNQNQNGLQGSPSSLDAYSQTQTQRKTYKPYNIIIHNRYVPYTPKFDLPEITWDKYDRQMFRNFDKKQQPPVGIMKEKNDQMNTFQDYTTWNQQYGEAR